MIGYLIVPRDTKSRDDDKILSSMPKGDKELLVVDSLEWAKINGFKDMVQEIIGLEDIEVDPVTTRLTTVRLIIYTLKDEAVQTSGGSGVNSTVSG